MIQSEKELEDYICDHQEQFIETLKGYYVESADIKFLGRQVRIGINNIADLIYYFDEDVIDKDGTLIFTNRYYIIVELKYRYLEAKDLAQLSRYMNTLNEKLSNDEKYFKHETFIDGVFVSFGLNNDMQEISMTPNIYDNIHFININTNISFERFSCSYREEYINDLKLDDRIEELYQEV